jgi:hypothetical protein
MVMNAWDRFVPVWHAYDKFNDEPERLAFMVGRKAKGSRKWVMFRCSVQCFETGCWGSVDEAKAWGDRLTSRRPVRWELNSSKPE